MDKDNKGIVMLSLTTKNASRYQKGHTENATTINFTTLVYKFTQRTY